MNEEEFAGWFLPMSPAEMDFLASRRATRLEICAGFGVPLTITPERVEIAERRRRAKAAPRTAGTRLKDEITGRVVEIIGPHLDWAHAYLVKRISGRPKTPSKYRVFEKDIGERYSVYDETSVQELPVEGDD